MATRTRSEMLTLWRNILQAGGPRAYIDAQLRERGFLVQRRDADSMSERELKRYKEELRAESQEKRRLEREAWQAYRASHIVHLGENVYFNDADDWDRWDLADAEERRAENELPPLDNPAQLAEALGVSVGELRWFAYHRDAAESVHYRRFTIPKGRSGEERAIWAPLPRLKEMQRWILREILEKLPVHGAAHGFLAGRSILTNAAAHTGSRLVLGMDLKDFFPTITLPRVKGLFRKAGYREQVATLLALLCTESPREIVQHEGKTYYIAMGPRCLPQGAPTSPGITNAICLRLDRRLAGLAAKQGWRYTRYADDLTFSIPAKGGACGSLQKVLGGARAIVEDEGFTIHDRKTHVARSGGQQKVTGLIVNGDGPPRVPRELRRQLRAAIHNVEHGKPLREGDFPQRMVGYAAFVHMTDPELGGELLASFKKLC